MHDLHHRGGTVTGFSGSKDRLLACGLLTSEMLTKKRKHRSVSFYEGEKGAIIYNAYYYHDVIELSQEERAMAEFELAKIRAGAINWLRRQLGLDDDED